MRISDWSSDVCSSDLTVHVTQLAINHLQSVESCPPRVCGIGLEGRLSGVDQSISLNVRLRHSLLKFPVVCRDSGGLNESEVESRRSPLVKMHGISDTKQTGDLKQIDGAVGDIR